MDQACEPEAMSKFRIVPLEPNHDQIQLAYIHLSHLMKDKKARETVRLIYRDMVAVAPSPRRGGLTKPQRRTLEVLTEVIDETNVPPTLREMRALLGYADHSRVFRIFRVLKRKGYIDIGPGIRDVRILKRPEET
jgi:hypothetical protein